MINGPTKQIRTPLTTMLTNHRFFPLYWQVLLRLSDSDQPGKMSNVSGRIWEIHLLQLVGETFCILWLGDRKVEFVFNSADPKRLLLIHPLLVFLNRWTLDSTQICMLLHVCTQFWGFLGHKSGAAKKIKVQKISLNSICPIYEYAHTILTP